MNKKEIVPEIEEMFKKMRGNKTQEDIYLNIDDPRNIIAKSTYQNIEYGITRCPRKNTMDIIAKSLGQDPDFLYTEYMRLQKENDMKKQQIQQNVSDETLANPTTEHKKRNLIIGDTGRGKGQMIIKKIKETIPTKNNIIVAGSGGGAIYYELKNLLNDYNYDCISLYRKTYQWDIFKTLPAISGEDDEQLDDFINTIFGITGLPYDSKKEFWYEPAKDLLIASILTANEPYSINKTLEQMEKIVNKKLDKEYSLTSLQKFNNYSEEIRNSAYHVLLLRFQKLRGQEGIELCDLNSNGKFLYTDSSVRYDMNYNKADIYLMELINSSKDSAIPLYVFIENIDELQLMTPQISELQELTKDKNVYWYIGINNITQLKSYGEKNAQYIIDNSESIIYLGSIDEETAEFVSDLVNENNDKLIISPDEIRKRDYQKAIVIENNEKPKIVEIGDYLGFKNSVYGELNDIKDNAQKHSSNVNQRIDKLEETFLDKLNNFLESRNVIINDYTEQYNRYKLIVLKTILNLLLLATILGLVIYSDYLKKAGTSIYSSFISITKQEQIKSLWYLLGPAATMGLSISMAHYFVKSDPKNPSSPYFYAFVLLVLIPLIKLAFF